MTQVLASVLYQTLAEIARYLEEFADTSEYGFTDNGETLEINEVLLTQCRSNPDWLALEERYKQVNGNIFSPDADFYLADWD